MYLPSRSDSYFPRKDIWELKKLRTERFTIEKTVYTDTKHVLSFVLYMLPKEMKAFEEDQKPELEVMYIGTEARRVLGQMRTERRQRLLDEAEKDLIKKVKREIWKRKQIRHFIKEIDREVQRKQIEDKIEKLWRHEDTLNPPKYGIQIVKIITSEIEKDWKRCSQNKEESKPNKNVETTPKSKNVYKHLSSYFNIIPLLQLSSTVKSSATIVIVVLFLVLPNTTAADSIHWKLNTTSLTFGKDVRIICEISETEKPEHMAWRKIPGGQTIGINEVSANDEKYGVYLEYKTSTMMYNLIIKNFNETDMNIIYKCESGFLTAFGNLTVHEGNVILVPKIDEEDMTVSLKNGKLKSMIRMSSVYPRPQCSAVFAGTNLTNISMTVYEKEFFYGAEFELLYQTSECKGKLDVSCHIDKETIKLRRHLDECKKSSDQNSSDINPSVIIFICVSISLVGILTGITWKVRRRRRYEEAGINDQMIVNL